MTSTCLPPTAAPPAPSRPRPGVVLAEALTTARVQVSRAAAVTGTGLSNADLTTAAQDLAALRSQVEALSLAVLAEARDRGRAGPIDTEADIDPAAWWGRLTGDPTEVLRGGLWIARLLKTKYHHTRRALEDGRIRLSQAKVLVRAAERAPKGLKPEQVAAAEEALVLTATGQGTRTGRPMPAHQLRGEARRVYAGLLPTKTESDKAEGDDLADEEDHAERETYLSLHDRGDGTTRGAFVVPALHARLLQHALERLSAPRRLSRDTTGHAVTDESAAHLGPSHGERLGSAFCELLEHLPTDTLPASGVELLVKIDLDQMITGLGAGTLDDGTPLSVRAIRRLSCTAGHTPVVLAGKSLPLDLGRTRRLFTRAQQRAVAAHHDTCAITGCTRPLPWCELHHLTPWSQGGRTDLRDALPLCGYHHRRVHDPIYELTRRPGGDWALRRRQ